MEQIELYKQLGGLDKSWGVEELQTLDGPMLKSGEARKTGTFTESLQEIYESPTTLIRKDQRQIIYGPLELLSSILKEGEKGGGDRSGGLDKLSLSAKTATSADVDSSWNKLHV